MSKTRNKSTPKKEGTGAARKSSPSRQGRLKVGDWVRILDISKGLKDPHYDLKNAESRKMRTAELCRFCVGRDFQVRGFQRDWIELEVSDDPVVRKEFGKWHTIWMELKFLTRVPEKNHARTRKDQRDPLSVSRFGFDPGRWQCNSR